MDFWSKEEKGSFGPETKALMVTSMKDLYSFIAETDECVTSGLLVLVRQIEIYGRILKMKCLSPYITANNGVQADYRQLEAFDKCKTYAEKTMEEINSRREYLTPQGADKMCMLCELMMKIADEEKGERINDIKNKYGMDAASKVFERDGLNDYANSRWVVRYLSDIKWLESPNGNPNNLIPNIGSINNDDLRRLCEILYVFVTTYITKDKEQVKVTAGSKDNDFSL